MHQGDGAALGLVEGDIDGEVDGLALGLEDGAAVGDAPTVQLWYATKPWPAIELCTKIARSSAFSRTPTTYARLIVSPICQPADGRTASLRLHHRGFYLAVLTVVKITPHRCN